MPFRPGARYIGSMSYYISAKLAMSIDDAIEVMRGTLADQGFGVLMDLNIQETLKTKTGADVGGYRVLGACNPGFARDAIATEPVIGTMLPCSVLFRDAGAGQTEVAVIDPAVVMQPIKNPDLTALATAIRERLAQSIKAAEGTSA